MNRHDYYVRRTRPYLNRRLAFVSKAKAITNIRERMALAEECHFRNFGIAIGFVLDRQRVIDSVTIQADHH